MEDVAAVPAYVTLAEGTIASDYALKNLNKSLGEAQAEFTPASKGEESKWGGYKYTSLENIIKAVRPALTKHHLTVSQFPVVDLELKTVRLVTRLVHWDSGEWMQNSLDIPAELALGKDGAAKFNQQTIGGSSTYAQKYAYKTILGIPDSEEMIDSSEEKGDLPARSKQQQHTAGATKTYTETAKRTGPTEDDFKMWHEAFAECGTIEEWNTLIVPMMKERADHPQYGRQFIIAAAEEAKKRGYMGDRTTGAYKTKTPPPAKPGPTVDEYEKGYEERQAAS